MDQYDSATMCGEVGPKIKGLGALTGLRLGKNGQLIKSSDRGRYAEDALNGKIFSCTLNATATGIAAGQIVGAAAAAVIQFSIFNPLGSGKALVFLKFGMGVISQTTAVAGPVFHGFFRSLPTNVSIGGTIINHLSMTASGSVAIPYVIASQTTGTMTAAPAVQILCAANFQSTAVGTTPTVAFYTPAVEILDGSIALAPGTGWAPLHSGAGSAVLHGYSLTWLEVDLP